MEMAVLWVTLGQRRLLPGSLQHPPPGGRGVPVCVGGRRCSPEEQLPAMRQMDGLFLREKRSKKGAERVGGGL